MIKVIAMVAMLGGAVNAHDEYCRALVMSGGSHNGAWEAGVIWGLTHYGDPANFAWDVITGVSAGAINTGATAVFATGDEVAMTEYLSKAWQGISTESVWIPRKGGKAGIVYSLFEEPSILNDDPLVPTVASIIEPFKDTGILRKFTVAAADQNTGEYVTFNQDNVTFEELPQAVVSSGSIPVVFAPQHIKDYVLTDGGTVWDVNIDSAVNQCLDMGFAEDKIILDVAVCSKIPTIDEVPSTNAIKNWLEAFNIKKNYGDMNSIAAELRAFPEVTMQYYFQESGTGCPPSSQLDFSNSTTWCLQEAGRRDAQNMLNIGQDAIHETLADWFDDKLVQRDYPYFGDYLKKIFGF